MTTTSRTDPLVGRVVDDRYRIVRKVARGGMATVYLADDLRLTRKVAVKVMHESLGSDQDFVDRFDREARAAARLSHPNVVSVFDQGIDDGRPYIVMELVEGSTLRQVITREAPMTPARAVELMSQVAEAVAAAHEAGIIHRDLKPENVLISRRGQLKVADFGLARAVTAHTATANGMLIGTVSYIAPELVTHGHADTRCDVYAMGVVLYEMLTGKKPHTGETPIQVAYSHVHNEIEPPSASAPSQWQGTPNAVPDYVDALVMAAAARQPADRPHDATLLAEHLSAAREALSTGILNDPILAARMHGTILDPDDVAAEMATAEVPLVTSPSPVPSTSTLRLDSAAPTSPELGGVGGAATEVPASLPSENVQLLTQRRARQHRRGRNSLIMLVVMSLMLGVGAWYLLAGRFTTMPSFVNLTQAKAQELAAQKGFTITFGADFSETVAVGLVVRTDPAAGDRIAYGGSLTAYLSRGPERYAVPSLAGRTVDQADIALKEARLMRGKVTEVWDNAVPVGQVISSSIAAGTMVKPQTQIDLRVSKGPAPIKIVSYVGKTFLSAKTYYENAGLKVLTGTAQNSDTVPSGSVISQNPTSGTLPKGGTITFVVSKGPVYVAVPNVIGKTEADAKAVLAAAGFAVKVKKSGWRRTVTSTDPWPGSMAPKGSTVTINLNGW